MRKKTRQVFIAFAAILICAGSFWIGSKLFKVDTKISVASNNILAVSVQELDSDSQLETKPNTLPHRKTNMPHTDLTVLPEKRSLDTWSNIIIEDLSQTDAKIRGDIALERATSCVESGFYFGTSPDALSKNDWWDVLDEGIVGSGDKEITLFFKMSKYGQKLKPGTTYYFELYIIDEYGNEYTSEIRSFTTYE